MIVRDLTGQPIGKVIEERILTPLRLTNTSFPTTEGMPEPATVGYMIQGGKTTPAPRLRPSDTGAAGAMVSTVGDLQVWAKALGAGALLSPATAAARLKFLPLTTFGPLQGSGVSAAMPASYGLGLANLGGLLGHNASCPATRPICGICRLLEPLSWCYSTALSSTRPDFSRYLMPGS